ncbi:MAG: ATP-binding protein [Crenarchaeota archaeon]|nr:ATP-binding protein [Thermoproteota archaeon]
MSGTRLKIDGNMTVEGFETVAKAWVLAGVNHDAEMRLVKEEVSAMPLREIYRLASVIASLANYALVEGEGYSVIYEYRPLSKVSRPTFFASLAMSLDSLCEAVAVLALKKLVIAVVVNDDLLGFCSICVEKEKGRKFLLMSLTSEAATRVARREGGLKQFVKAQRAEDGAIELSLDREGMRRVLREMTNASSRVIENYENDTRPLLVIIQDQFSLNALDKLRKVAEELGFAEELEKEFGRVIISVEERRDTEEARKVARGGETQNLVAVEVEDKMIGRTVTITLPLRDPEWSLDDIYSDIRSEVQQLLVEPMKRGAPYAARGLLIAGPPGVGKTVIAHAIAQGLGVKVLTLLPGLYRSQWYGATESILLAIYREIRSRKDLLIHVDDADFLMRRASHMHAAFVAEVSTWLAILQDRERPPVVFTSNLLEAIDPALLRPGRIDGVVLVGYPSFEDRATIARRLARRYGFEIGDDEAEEIARLTRWFSPAEIDAAIRIALAKGGGELRMSIVEEVVRRFSINIDERRAIQERIRDFAKRHSQGIAIVYAPRETQI